jgi:hypothetical protein
MEENSNLEVEVRALLERALADIRPSAFAIWRHPAGDGGVELVVLPAEQRNARIRIYVMPQDDTSFGMVLGKGTFVEAFARDRIGALEYVAVMSRAVIDGEFSEEIWSKEGEVIQSIGRLKYDGRVHKHFSHSGRISFRGAICERLQYQPYPRALRDEASGSGTPSPE